MRVCEIKVEVTIPTEQYGNKKITMIASLDPMEDLLAARENLIKLCYGQEMEMEDLLAARENLIKLCYGQEMEVVKTPIEAYEKSVDAQTKARLYVVKTPIEAYEKSVDAQTKARLYVDPLVGATELEAMVEETPIKKAKAPRKVKVKYTAYDRSSELHKKLFSSTLDVLLPDWKKDAIKAKTASMFLEKSDFLNEDGVVLDSFKDALLKVMSV